MDTNNLYIDLIPKLWKSISSALKLCVELDQQKKPENIVENNPDLIDCFIELDSIKDVLDPHISLGLYESHRKRKDLQPRILSLTIRAFEDAQNIKTTKNSYLIPSPLGIIYKLFIVPSHSYTAAYAIYTVTQFLEQIFDISPAHPSLTLSKTTRERIIFEEQVNSALYDFENFESMQGRWPKILPEYAVNGKEKVRSPEWQSFVGHFVAMKGIAHLWFGKSEKKTAIDNVKDFLCFDDSDIKNQIRNRIITNRFRLSSKFKQIPEWGSIINQIFGYPIPLKGADVLFFGGLKPSSTGGLVISLSGGAGVGKTSFALSLADAYSPFGTKCLYISLEEDIKDLEKRLANLKPQIQKELRFFNKGNIDWFSGIKYTPNVDIETFTQEINEIAQELNEVNTVNKIKLNKYIPYIIVVDNINELISKSGSREYSKIETFIEACRKLNSVILLISPEGLPKDIKLEYLVDVGIELTHKNLDKEDKKPIRIFNLFKTRHQMSRQGSHIFHMSGNEGFRLAPQIPSQIDRKEKIERSLADEKNKIHSLNFIKDGKTNYKIANCKGRDAFISLYPTTNILVHGYGSAGKAGFSLKLLLSPPVGKEIKLDKIEEYDFSSLRYKRNILIISFLYPEKYYDELISEKIHKEISHQYSGLVKPKVDYIILYPGYLSPQDFLKKITSKLDEATLEGVPYTGVLIDGLHNVFLQFEKLQNSNMVWPMLYNILSRYSLTVVSTFTNFSLNDKLIAEDGDKNQLIRQSIPDHMLLQKGMSPFLHALVKATDYYFFMEELSFNRQKRYLLGVKGSIKQNVPEEFLEWSRDLNNFTAIYTRKELMSFLQEENEIEPLK